MSRIIKRTRRPRFVRKTVKLELDHNEIIFLKGLAILRNKSRKPLQPGRVAGVDSSTAAKKLLALGLLSSDDGGRTVTIPPGTLKEINRWRVSSGKR